MENEMIEELAQAKMGSKIMRALIDTILDNSKLTYDGAGLRIESDSEMFAIIKAFFSDEYENRFDQLKAEAEELQKKAQEGKTNG